MNYVDKDINLTEKNEYYKDYDYIFVQNTNNLYPTNKHEIINIIYTTLNNGLDETTFYCNYDECTNDINEIAENREYLSSINNILYNNKLWKNNNSNKKTILRFRNTFNK